MKKRIFAILLCLIVVMTLCVVPMTVSAEEFGSETAGPVADHPTVEELAPAPETPVFISSEGVGEGENSHNTIFTRVWEFVRTYSNETITFVGSLILLILNLVLRRANSKMSKETKEALEIIKGGVGETLGGQNSVVDVTNKMIDGYNGLSQRYDAMKESYDLYGATEDERNRIVGAVFASNMAVLEILSTVYVNSKNLPQGVKDLVNLKYANCLKALGDDKQLRAIVEAVRNNIGAAAEITETSIEDAEV